MALQISISNAIGARAVAGGGGVDPDAQAFITASGITDATQQSAINQLVVDLKGYSIWSKMEALYPMVGGTSTAHKFNLKNPLDTDAAFRMTFHGGVTHSSNGITFATNGYANTKWLPSVNSTGSNVSAGAYSRTNLTAAYALFGALNSVYSGISISPKAADQSTYFCANNYITDGLGNFVTDTRGFWHVNRDNINLTRLYRNGSSIRTATPTSTSNFPTVPVVLGARNYIGTIDLYFNGTLAFAFLGDTLDSTESANFYTAVQAFQTTLGRSIGTQTVSDADAQAFVTAANIDDQVEANAVNNLVIGMKADGLWTKMKAVYPFVGGTSTSTSYNLKNTAQYQITWNGGWTWNNNGVTGNGVNGWGNTGLIPNLALTLNSTHQSLYIRNTGNLGVDDFGSATNGTTSLMRMIVKNSGTNDHIIDHYAVAQRITGTVADSTGFFVVSRENSTSLKSKRNDVSLGTNTNSNTGTLPTHALYLGALNNIGTAVNYTARNYAFASAGDGLSDTDMTNLRNRVVTFQTALNRNV
jgi:hypothetical protein